MKNTLFILFIVIVGSCRDFVQDEFPDFREVPAINSFLVDDSIVRVQVSLTGKLDTSNLKTVDNASVNLYRNHQFVETLNYHSEGVYISNAVAESGNSYRIEVDIPGYDRVTAHDSIPGPAKILSVSHIKKAGKDEEGHFYPALLLTFNNTRHSECYYEIVIYAIDNGRQFPVELIDIKDPVLLNEGIPLALFRGELVPDGEYEMTLNYTTGFSDQNGMQLFPLVIEFRTVSFDYYRYKQMLYLYELGRYPDNMLSTTSVTSPYSNASGGYGIFAGYSVFRSDTILAK
ncbi:MAG: DUF4249 family protein [Bacteroidales bacterium]|nr:DUF4249 family protein [Bacteroidales bacterium]